MISESWLSCGYLSCPANFLYEAGGGLSQLVNDLGRKLDALVRVRNAACFNSLQIIARKISAFDSKSTIPFCESSLTGKPLVYRLAHAFRQKELQGKISWIGEGVAAWNLDTLRT